MDVANARSLYFSFIEGRHLPNWERRRIGAAVDLLLSVDPEAHRTLQRFHAEGSRDDLQGEANAARKLADCLSQVR